ncbi:MAG: spermidine synthase [Chitinophagales bacterium]
MTYKPSLWQKIASWIWPYNIEKVNSKVSGQLEVNLQYGQITIDSLAANYSFGNLHLVYREALSSLSFNYSKQYKVLILGFGAGSIAHIFRNELGINCSITGVELDEEIIKLSKKYFPPNLFHNTKMHITDAFEYMKHEKETYDIVCVDLFIDTNIPEIFQQKEFILHLKNSLKPTSKLFMNSMQNNEVLKQNWEEVFGNLNAIAVQDNEVLFHQN